MTIIKSDSNSHSYTINGKNGQILIIKELCTKLETSYIPVRTRLQIYHSFVHSHLNFCSIVWGFAAKSHFDSVLSKRKSGIRAIMAGFVNFKYRDGIIPSHTKPSFNSM